jgi:hypothetical protein
VRSLHRVDDDFCGLPLPGFRVFVWIVVGTLHSVIGYLDGAVELPSSFEER